jgi:hypothetical protein
MSNDALHNPEPCEDWLQTSFRSQPVTTYVAATFDAQLPFDTLPWKSFENFCHDLLSCLFPDTAIHQYGGEGQDQKGIDLEMRWADGNIWTFQVKRESQFGPAKIRKVIEEHELISQKKILLLSRIATAKARDALRNHADWELWDRQGLSVKFRSLDPWDQHRLIDIYFPGQHCALTGKLRSTTWLSKDDFFSHFLSDQALFHHCWEVVGRNNERQRLHEALADQSVKVIGLIGGPGEGKSRLLIDGLDQIQRSQPEARIVIACGQSLDTADLAQLGRVDTLMVVDDAQDLESLDPLCRHLLQKANARLLFACHPAKAPAIETSLAQFGLNGTAYQAITLERPSQDDAEALARQVLARHGGDQRLARFIGGLCQDSPLALVIGAQLVAREGLDPRKFASSQAFQATVWSRYIRMISASVGDGAGGGPDTDRVRRLLLLFALLQPLDPDAAGVLDLLESLHQIQTPEATRLTKSLLLSGVLVQRGPRYSLSPDLLADALIVESCITAQGAFNTYPEQLFHRADHRYKGQLLFNLSRLDWRLRVQTVVRQPRLQYLWSLIDRTIWPQPSLLNAAIAAAFYQPQCAMYLARRWIAAGQGSHPEVCRLIKGAVSSGEQLQSACELLWELARSDSRDTQHHPNHPLRVLQELARPVVLHSQHDVNAVVAFALRLLPAAESWTGISTPFAILKGALITTADHLQSKPGRPMEIVTQVYRVNPAAVRPLRRQVIDAILNSLSSANRRQAFAAADLLEHAVRYPDGWPELPLSDLEKEFWTEEFQDTLQRLNAMLDLHNLPAPVLVRVAQSVARFSFHTNGHLPKSVLASVAAAVLVRLDRDLPTRLCRHLMDGWCYLTWNRKEQVRIRLHESLATVLEREQPDPKALMQEINAGMAEIAAYTPKGWQQRAKPFIDILLSRHQGHAWALLALQRSDPSAPLAAFAPHALAIVLSTAPLQAHAWIENSPTQDDNHRRLIAAAYAQVGFEGRALLPQDRARLEPIFCSDDPETLSQLPLIVMRLVRPEPQLAIDLITSADPDLLSSNNQRSHATAEILLWLGDEELGIPLEQISQADAERLLRLLQAPANLDGDHLRDFLKRFAPRWPELVVNLAKTRLERCLEEPAHFSLPLWHQHHPSVSLDLLELPQGPALLSACLDWGLPRADQAAFGAAWANLVACLFGWREPQLTTTLWSWWQNAPQPRLKHLQLLAALLAEAPERFPLEQHAFVSELLLAAAAVDRASSEWLVAGLAAAAQQLHDRLPPGHPARQLYATLRDRAHADIAPAEEADRSLVEG